MKSKISDKLLVGENLERPLATLPKPCGPVGFERRKDERGCNHVVVFPHALRLEDESAKKRTVWFNTSKGEEPSEARRRAWEWLSKASKRYA